MANQSDLDQLSFEDALGELESVVARLESGQVSLEESINLYTRGTALKAHCEARLKAAEARIEAITVDESGAAQGTRPFDGADT